MRAFSLGLLAAVALAACEQAPDQDTAQTVETPTTRTNPSPTPVASPPPREPLIETPPAQILTVEGHELILEFETSGQRGYNPHPEWPRGASGVTIGVGYDLGYSSAAVIRSDWQKLPPFTLSVLAKEAGITGQRAAREIQDPTVRGLLIRWDLAIDVFDNVDVARWQAASRRALPGFDQLRLNCQAALISLGFNRGWSMQGPNRSEMRNIRDYGVPKQDYPRIAAELRHMVRLWKGTSYERGLTRRRLAEAELVLTP